jgi:hypothetical protein
MLLKLVMELLLSLSPQVRTVCMLGLTAGILVFLLIVFVALLIIAFSPGGTERLSLILRLLPWAHIIRQTRSSHKTKSWRTPRGHRSHRWRGGGTHEHTN